MQSERSRVMSIAGLDPSGGAGVLLDSSIFKAHELEGLGVITCLTAQTEQMCYGVKPLDSEEISFQLMPLIKELPIRAIKIGVISDLKKLTGILQLIRKHLPDVFICWDPVISASSGLEFLASGTRNEWEVVLQHLNLITPNQKESVQILETLGLRTWGDFIGPCNVLVKGEIRTDDEIIDVLYYAPKEFVSFPSPLLQGIDLHGSGCRFSAHFVSYIAKGQNLQSAIINAKQHLDAIYADAAQKENNLND